MVKMDNKCKFSYNTIDDSLIISCNYQNEQAKENIMFDDLIFHLNENGKIIGLQIRNISSIMEESGLNYKILDNLREVHLDIIPKQDSLFIKVNLISDTREEKLSLGRIFMPKIKSQITNL